MDRVRRIELLVRAADTGSFAKAARSLDLTPSAVSHAITELEKELRVPMFHRTTRQLRLTEDGEAVYRRGCDILRQLAELDSDVHRAPERLSGTLRVGLPVALSQYVIMPALSGFVRRYRNLQLNFHVQTQPKEMHAQGMDMLLRIGEPPESSLIARRIAQIRFAVYAAPDYLKVAGTPARPEDLLLHQCLVFKPASMTKPLDEWEFERAGEHKLIKVTPAVVTHDRSGQIAAAVAGAGLMRAGCFDPSLVAMGQLRRVLADWSCPGGFNIYAMFRKSPRMPPKLVAFLEFVADAFAAFDPDEVTLVHDQSFGEWLRRRPHSRH
jgi:DNA-binding transcriptional LysR family regulator